MMGFQEYFKTPVYMENLSHWTDDINKKCDKHINEIKESNEYKERVKKKKSDFGEVAHSYDIATDPELKFYIEESEGYNDITPLRRKVVNGEVVFELGVGETVNFTVSGLVGTTALGSEIVNAVSNAQFTPVIVDGLSSTAELGTVAVQTDLLLVTQVGTVIIGGDAHDGGATNSNTTIDVNG